MILVIESIFHPALHVPVRNVGKIMVFSCKNKPHCVVNVKRCINRLFLKHFIRARCGQSNFRKCGPKNRHKNTSKFHECFNADNFGAAKPLDSEHIQARKGKME